MKAAAICRKRGKGRRGDESRSGEMETLHIEKGRERKRQKAPGQERKGGEKTKVLLPSSKFLNVKKKKDLKRGGATPKEKRTRRSGKRGVKSKKKNRQGGEMD